MWPDFNNINPSSTVFLTSLDRIADLAMPDRRGLHADALQYSYSCSYCMQPDFNNISPSSTVFLTSLDRITDRAMPDRCGLHTDALQYSYSYSYCSSS